MKFSMSNNLENSSYRDDVFETIYLVLRNIQGLITVFVNLLTIIVIVRYKRLHTSSNVLIVSLAVADFITGLGAFLLLSGFIIVRTSGDESVWLQMCSLTTWFNMVATFGNIIHFFTMSVDRFLAMRNPIFYHKSVNRRKMIIVVGVVWLIIVPSATLFITLAQNPELSVGTSCTWSNVLKDFVYWYLLIVPYSVISMISTCLYLWVGCMVRKISTQTCPRNIRESKRTVQQRKVTKMMALVIVMYYALYLPALIESFFQYDVTVKFYVSKIVLVLFLTNALINPFIYSRQSVEFNAAYRKILRIKKKVKIHKTNEFYKSHKQIVPTVSLNCAWK